MNKWEKREKQDEKRALRMLRCFADGVDYPDKYSIRHHWDAIGGCRRRGWLLWKKRHQVKGGVWVNGAWYITDEGRAVLEAKR